MTVFDRSRGPTRRLRPVIEGLEGRALLSSAGHPRPNPFNLPPPIQAGEIAGNTETALPHELLKSSFGAVFTGSYIVGPPQFADNISQTVIWGQDSHTWVKTHSGYMAITVYTPKDPGASPQLTATIQGPGRTAPEGNLILNLQYLTTQVQPQDRVLPTELKWSVNGSASSGIYAGATGNGLMAIKYGPNARQPTQIVYGGVQRGISAAEISGLVFLVQTPQLFHPG